MYPIFVSSRRNFVLAESDTIEKKRRTQSKQESKNINEPPPDRQLEDYIKYYILIIGYTL